MKKNIHKYLEFLNRIVSFSFGAVVQLGARNTGSVEVEGSTPFGSISLNYINYGRRTKK